MSIVYTYYTPHPWVFNVHRHSLTLYLRDQDVASRPPRLRLSEGQRAEQQAGVRDLPHPAARHQGHAAEVCGRSVRDNLQHGSPGLCTAPSHQGETCSRYTYIRNLFPSVMTMHNQGLCHN